MKKETEKAEKLRDQKDQQKTIDELRFKMKDLMKQAVDGRAKLIKEHKQQIELLEVKIGKASQNGSSEQEEQILRLEQDLFESKLEVEKASEEAF